MKATREVREGLLLVFPLKKEKKKGSDDSEMSPFVLSRKKRKKRKEKTNLAITSVSPCAKCQAFSSSLRFFASNLFQSSFDLFCRRERKEEENVVVI